MFHANNLIVISYLYRRGNVKGERTVSVACESKKGNADSESSSTPNSAHIQTIFQVTHVSVLNHYITLNDIFNNNSLKLCSCNAIRSKLIKK